ncbi:MAG: radical SAM protein [Lachnospiraceae bacterium]|nr:radical SAM protein [Lachnospiraceae bacterium]
MNTESEFMISEEMLLYTSIDGLHLYNTANNFSHFMFKGLEAEVVESINRYHNLQQVWSQISEAHSVKESSKAKQSFMSYIERLYTKHIIEYGSEDKVIMGKSDRICPLFCSIELTDICNFKCSHCYKEAGSSCEGYISMEEIEMVAKNLRPYLYSIDLTGGEATLHPKFNEIVRKLEGPKLHLLTNGSRLVDVDDDILKRFEIIQVSLYGKSAEEYVKFAGNHGFDKVCKGIKKVIALQIPIVIAINLREDVVDDLESYIRICEELGAKSIRFGIPLKSGRNDGVIADWDISSDKMAEFVNKNLILREKYRNMRIEAFTEDDVRKEVKLPDSKTRIVCGAGKSDICISEKGIIRPCVMLPEKYFGSMTVKEYVDHLENGINYDYSHNIQRAVDELRDKGKSIDSFCESAFA